MKLAPASSDLVIKLALVAAAAGLAWWAYRRTVGAAGQVLDTVTDFAGQVADEIIVGVNPANPSNWINQGVTAAGAAVVSPTGPGRNADGSWSLGGAIYDLLHPGWAQDAIAPVTPGAPDLWGSEGRRNQPIYQDQGAGATDWSQLSSLGAP